MLVIVVGGHGGHRDRDLNRKNKYFGHGHQYRLRLKTSATIIENGHGHGHGEDHENNSQIQCLFYSVIVSFYDNTFITNILLPTTPLEAFFGTTSGASGLIF